jgi:regulator of nucleoside diphosphate kinase
MTRPDSRADEEGAVMSPVPIISREDFGLLDRLGDCPALHGELRRATVVAESEVPADVVTMNSRVAFADVTAGLRGTVTLVYPHARAGEGRVPVTAPLGAALIGLRAGQEIEWDFPLVGRHRVRVEAVLSQPPRRRKVVSASDGFVVPWDPRALDCTQ